MEWITKRKFEIILGVVIIFLYFALRLPNLTLQPIFADEAIYIRWAQVMRAEPTLRFLPLSDGKTPLFMWVMFPLLKIFQDPLFAGRFLSVICGFVTLLGVYFLARKVFGRGVAFWSALIYVIVPYTVFFDRMALVDSMFAAFSVWALYFAIWLGQSQRLDFAMILGFILGGAWLTKTPAMINLFLLPVTLIGFDKNKLGKYRILKHLLLLLVAILIALAMYNLLRLGPEFQQLSKRNADYVFSLSELKERPLDPFVPHFKDIIDWFPKLLTWPIIGFMVYGLWFMVKVKNRLGVVILLWALIPLLLQMFILKTFTARYLLFSIPPLLIIAGYGIEKISNRFLTLILLLIILPFALRFDYQLITNPPPDNLPKEERRGYFEDWTAGYGFAEIAKFLVNERKNGPVVVGTEGSFGTLPDGLYIYLDKADIGMVGGGASISAQLRESAKLRQTYFVANRNRLAGYLEKANLLKTYEKVKPLDNTPQDAIVLYRVIP